MIKNGEITLAEARRVLRHYWWILPLTVIGCGALGLLSAIVLPKRYTSQTLVLVDQPTVPSEYVRPVVSEELNHRLASMQEQILSRTRLQPIIEKFGLYTKDRERQASQTTSFLSGQLDEAKSKLDEQDAKLAQFKRLHLGSLPQEEQTNLSLLTGMNSQLEANTQALSRAEQEKALNESLLSQQEATWKMSQTGQNPE